MAELMKVRAYINRCINSIGKKGSYIVETAITLPIMIIALVAMNSIILMYACIETANFVVITELRRVAAESIATDTSVLLPYRIKEQLDKDGLISEQRVKEFRYRTVCSVNDEIIQITINLGLKSKNPLGFASEAEYELSGITRAYVGKKRDVSRMSLSEFLEDETEAVFIFPARGEKYHNKSCNVLTASSTSAILSRELKKKYRSCPKCRSSKAEEGSLIYVFPDEGESYHMPGCETLSRNYIEVEKKVALERGYEPCAKCGG